MSSKDQSITRLKVVYEGQIKDEILVNGQLDL